MRDVRTIGTSLLALLLWIVSAAPAEAQLCRGGPSFAAMPYQVSAIAEVGDETRGVGGDFFVGGRYLFGGAGFAVRDVEDTGSTGTEIASRVGLDLPVSRVQRIHLCPSGFVSFGTGPDIGDIDVSTFRVGAGLRAGVAVRDTDGLTVVPTFGIDVFRERLALESGGVEQDRSDGVGVASLGVGFIVNRRLALIPELAVPFSAADSEVTFSVRVSFAFGQR
jgi:hypothetical protein